MPEAPHVKAPQVEVEVAGRFVVRAKVLGHGAWSVVRPAEPINGYEPPAAAGSVEHGTQPVTKMVAKVIEKAYLRQVVGGDDRGRQEIEREVGALKAIPPQRSIVRFLELLENDTHYFIVFEEAARGDLCELILNSDNGRLSEATAKRYTLQILTAVLHCHRHGAAHRDIKPENLLVGDGDSLKLTDFGLAKVLRRNAEGQQTSSVDATPAFFGLAPDNVLASIYPHRLWDPEEVAAAVAAGKASAKAKAGPPYCKCHEVIGTLRYGAPEMFHAKFNRGHFDAFGADVWSLGVVVYIMLTGTFPFSAGGSADERETYKVLQEAPLHVPATLSPEARSFLQGMLCKDPAKRLRLWDALDHAWLRPEVAATDAARRRSFCLAADANTNGHANGESPSRLRSAPPRREDPNTLPPGLEALRAAVAAKEDATLSAAFDAALGDVAALQEAIVDLRRHAAAHAAHTAAPTTSSVMTPARATSPVVRRAQSPTTSARTPIRRAPGVAGSAVSPSPARTGVASPARTAVSPAPGPRVGRATPTRPGMGATSTPTRPTGTGTPTRTSAASSPTAASAAAAAARRGSPLARASPVQRRGTPVRTTGATAGPGVATTPARSTPGRIGGVTPVRTPGVATPTRAPGLESRGTPTRAVPRTSTPLRSTPVAKTAGATPSTPSGPALAPGTEVTYRKCRAVVRFVGSTGFAAGQWAGVEILDGAEGIHDGTSNVDKRRYFTCPPGKGVFVRPSQLTPA